MAGLFRIKTTHLIVQGVSHARRHVGDDPDPLASVFCRLELADSESQNTIRIAANEHKFDQD